MAKVTVQFEVEFSNEVSANEFKAKVEEIADRVAEEFMNMEGILEAEVKNIRIVL